MLLGKGKGMDTIFGTKSKSISPDDIVAELERFHGTVNYYTHRSPRTCKIDGYYTDGVKRMAELCNAQWLIDAIFSHQYRAIKDCQFQIWILEKMLNIGARKCAYLLRGEDGNGNILQRQTISYSDFPMKKIKTYLSDGFIPVCGASINAKVLMLPGER